MFLIKCNFLEVEGVEDNIPKTHSKYALHTETKYPDFDRKEDTDQHQHYGEGNKHMTVEKYQRKSGRDVDLDIKVSRESLLYYKSSVLTTNKMTFPQLLSFIFTKKNQSHFYLVSKMEKNVNECTKTRHNSQSIINGIVLPINICYREAKKE